MSKTLDPVQDMATLVASEVVKRLGESMPESLRIRPVLPVGGTECPAPGNFNCGDFGCGDGPFSCRGHYSCGSFTG